MRHLLFLILFFSLAFANAQKRPSPKATRILFIFDASKSMIAKHQNTSRMDGAKEL